MKLKILKYGEILLFYIFLDPNSALYNDFYKSQIINYIYK